MRSKLIGAILALLVGASLAGCTPTAGTGGGGAPPPRVPAPAGPAVGGAILVVETYDLKTSAIIPANERDYPLFVTINVLNHEEENAVGFPEHLLVAKNPWQHTVEWPQVDQFDRAEALVSVPTLTAGVGVTCRWTNLNGVPYASTGEKVQRGGGHRPGDQGGMECILLESMLGR